MLATSFMKPKHLNRPYADHTNLCLFIYFQLIIFFVKQIK